MGQKRKLLKIQLAAVRNGPPVSCCKFPVLGLGNSTAITLVFRCYAGYVNAKIDGFLSIFPTIREFYRQRAVRRRLPATRIAGAAQETGGRNA
jgi:hypothetical protein